MRIWIDITNTPHVNVLMPIYRHLLSRGHQIIITARDFSETIPLLKKNGIEPIVYGNHKGKNRVMKIIGLLTRMLLLAVKLPDFDLSFSLGGSYTSVVSFIRRKKSISFSDNDFATHKFITFLFGDYFIFPSYFKYENVKRKYHIKDSQIKLFHGFKEDIYIAEYVTDSNFLSQLPFDDFITIRPENLKAAYVPQNATTIVPELFDIFKDENILFLPRYEYEKQYAKGHTNVWYPTEPLNGLDVCYYTKAMLTGAGTFAREAALMGVPAVSFFPRNDFLSVDVALQEQGKEFKSRDPHEIKNYVHNAKRNDFSLDRCKLVLKEVLKIFDDIIAEND